MTITHLVRTESEGPLRWADTQKSARVKRNIGDKLTLNLSDAHPNWRKNPVGFARLHVPHDVFAREALPKGAEVSFYIVEDHSSEERPYIVVQYVEARR